MIHSQDNREGGHFCPLPENVAPKKPGKIELPQIYFKTILSDVLHINLVIWIIMLIVFQIHKVSFEMFFQSPMEFLPPAFNLKF